MDDVQIRVPYQEIDTFTNAHGDVWVRAGTGGVSTYEKANNGLRGKAWSPNWHAGPPIGSMFGVTSPDIGYGSRSKTCPCQTIKSALLLSSLCQILAER